MPAIETQTHLARDTEDPRRILTSLGVVVYDWDLESDRIAWGPSAADVLGAAEIDRWSTARSFDEAVAPCDGPTRADIAASAEGGDAQVGTAFAALYRLRLSGGKTVLVDDLGRWFADGEGRPVRVHGTMRIRAEGGESTDFARARSRLLDEIGQDLREGRSSGRALTLFVIAIANLAELNDELGFDAADGVIGTIMVRLGGAMRRRDGFARYAGNRFAIVLRGCGIDEAEIAAGACSPSRPSSPSARHGGRSRPGSPSARPRRRPMGSSPRACCGGRNRSSASPGSGRAAPI